MSHTSSRQLGICENLGGTYVWASTTEFPDGWPALSVPKMVEVRVAITRQCPRGVEPRRRQSFAAARAADQSNNDTCATFFLFAVFCCLSFLP
jgi:hypothetical protein